MEAARHRKGRLRGGEIRTNGDYLSRHARELRSRGEPPQFGHIVKDGGLGKFNHRREPAAIDNQTIIRLNRDTLYCRRYWILTPVR